MLSDIKATIDLNVLAAMMECAASKDDVRYYLNGVLLEVYSQQNIYVATDGHKLLAYRQTFSDTGKETPELIKAVIIPADECKALKPKKHELPEAHLTFETDGYLKVSRQDGSARLFRPLDGTFPDWRHIVPERMPELQPIVCPQGCSNPIARGDWREKKSVLICQHCGSALDPADPHCQFNWALAADLTKFAERMGINAPALVHNGSGPAYVDFNSENCFGLLMPFRTSAEGKKAEQPQWVKNCNLKAAAA